MARRTLSERILEGESVQVEDVLGESLAAITVMPDTSGTADGSSYIDREEEKVYISESQLEELQNRRESTIGAARQMLRAMLEVHGGKGLLYKEIHDYDIEISSSYG